MKKISLKISYAIIAVTILFFTAGLTSCATLSKISPEDAYNIGNGAGTLIRNLSGPNAGEPQIEPQQ